MTRRDASTLRKDAVSRSRPLICYACVGKGEKMSKEKFIFKKGETYDLDCVYGVENSFAKYMEKVPDNGSGGDAEMSDTVKFLANVSVTIKIDLPEKA
jgi:hypothetical protein